MSNVKKSVSGVNVIEQLGGRRMSLDEGPGTNRVWAVKYPDGWVVQFAKGVADFFFSKPIATQDEAVKEMARIASSEKEWIAEKGRKDERNKKDRARARRG